MQRLFTQIIATVFLFAVVMSTHGKPNTPSPRVLMVVSGYGQAQGNEKPGYEFDEFAKAYLVFKAHDIDVDIASPQGGAVEADEYDPGKAYNAEVLADKSLMEKLSNTLAMSGLGADNYDAVFVVGGKGAMFDLPNDKALQQFIANLYEKQGVIAAVCHGPAALVNVKLSNGEYLVAGKSVNGFTNDEELLFGKKWAKQFDFMLEDKLAEIGGKFQSSDIMLAHVAVDGRLITGQNPSSTVGVATAMLDALDVTVKPTPTYKDDRTLASIAAFLEGDSKALQPISNSPQKHHLALAGMYGYYYLKLATSELKKQQALALMMLAQAEIDNPALDVQIAKTQHQLGDTMASKKTLKRTLSKHPDFEPAQALMATITQ
ncbi:type 1 glutamine amidotransferase domain-containing protein [Alteromonas gracilis]|uniref:type 1 glutamine amidotransferase domain-containing protein n=1 Tax=Alteromonas gracilis TaxID=1479524 RepID=UPI003736A81C